MNSVQSILKSNFTSLKLAVKCEIKRVVRLTPDLNIQQKQTVKGKAYSRSFNPSIYQKNLWICGCDTIHRFFYFPCLLFTSSQDTSWTKTGVNDLGHVSPKMKVHENSAVHKNACFDLSVLGKYVICELIE